jgi:hypothetical protein
LVRGHRNQDGGAADVQGGARGAGPVPGKTSAAGQHYGGAGGAHAGGDEEGVSVTYVSSETDLVSKIIRTTTFGEADGAEDIPGMVAAIIAKAGGKKIRRLTIDGHGSEGNQRISETASIDSGALGQLAPLRSHFTSDAVVHLGGCNVGGGPRGQELLTALARTWGVRVSASTSFERPLVPGIEGHNAIAGSDGTMQYDESWIAGFGRTTGPSDDNDTRASLDRIAKGPGGLGALQMPSRYRAVSRLLGGYTGDDDATWIMKLFETAPAGDRRTLYKYVEGHDWSGDFKQGWFTNDDALWNGLSTDQATQLKKLLNDGMTPSKP